MGFQPGGEDAQVTQQFPNSVTSAKGCMGVVGGGRRRGERRCWAWEPREGGLNTALSRDDNTGADLKDIRGQDKSMRGGHAGQRNSLGEGVEI